MNDLQDFLDRQKAEERATMTHWLEHLQYANAKTLEQRIAEELIKIKAERIEAEVEKAARARYAEAVQAGLDRAKVPTIESPAGRAGVILRESNRNLLTPVIEAAQAACRDPFDAPAVFAALTQMATAKEKMRPLIGVAPEGIKWMDGHDETQFLSLKNLRERLKRVQERARKSAKERGKTRGL